MPEKISDRAQILIDGARLTSGDRDATYGDPYINLGLAGRLKEVFYAGATRQLGPAEREAIDLIFTKLGRIGTGSTIHRDNYLDGSVYFAIAYENAQRDVKD